MATSVNDAFTILYDLNGQPLENGYVFIGSKGFSAETNPQTAYWNEALTITASQPVRTLAGRLRGPDGKPGKLYVSGGYSITVKDKNQVLVYSSDVPSQAAQLGVFPERTAENAQEAAGLNDGFVITMAGDRYLVDSTATGALSATNDLGVDGLRYIDSLRFSNAMAVRDDARAFYPAGTILETDAEGFRYEVAASGATDEHVSTAGGVKLYINTGFDGDYPLLAFFANGDNSTDDAAALQKAVSVAVPERRYIALGGLSYFIDGVEIQLPECDGETGTTGLGNYGLKMKGPGKLRTNLSSGAFIKGWNWGGIPGRQYYGWHMVDVEIEGPGSGTASAVGPSNARLPIFERLDIRGFPGGAAIDVWASGSGGSFGGVVRDCYLGHQVFTLNGSFTCVDVQTQLFPNSVLYGVRFRGPGNSGGKANDWSVRDTLMYGTIGAGISQTWHTAYSGLGGSGNIKSNGNTIVSRMAKRIDQATVISATATTVEIALPPAPVNQTANSYQNCILQVVGGAAAGEVHRIASDAVSATRTITLVTSFAVTPSPGDEVRVIFGTPDLITEFGVGNFPVGIYFDHQYGWNSVQDYIEDVATPILGGDNADDNFSVIAPKHKGSDGFFMRWKDGDDFSPAVFLSPEVESDNQTATNNILTGTTMLRGRGTSATAETGFVKEYTNRSGDTLSTGMVVVTDPIGSFSVDGTTTLNADNPKVVFDLSGNTFPDLGKVPIALRSSTVRVDCVGTVNEGDTLVASATEYKAEVNNAQTNPKKILGYALSAGTDTLVFVDIL